MRSETAWRVRFKTALPLFWAKVTYLTVARSLRDWASCIPFRLCRPHSNLVLSSAWKNCQGVLCMKDYDIARPFLVLRYGVGTLVSK